MKKYRVKEYGDFFIGQYRILLFFWADIDIYRYSTIKEVKKQIEIHKNKSKYIHRRTGRLLVHAQSEHIFDLCSKP